MKSKPYSDSKLKISSNVELCGRVAVVTGASSGVGRAIALALARQGVRLCVAGRDLGRLSETVGLAREHAEATSFQIDFDCEQTLQPLFRHMERVGRVDVLVHSAGVIHEGLMEHARIEDLDAQFVTNVRGPYIVTHRLLPLLSVARGQIVFINSSAGLSAKRPEIGQYAATKHSLKAIADSLREEVNPRGIRVLTVYLGRTATRMQESLFRKNGDVYQPEVLLQPEDVASIVVQTLMLPGTAEITDISMRPMIRTRHAATCGEASKELTGRTAVRESPRFDVRRKKMSIHNRTKCS